MRTYKYFTLEERIQLENYCKEEKKVIEISKLLKRSRGSIYRELKKGKLKNSSEYSAFYANSKGIKRKAKVSTN